MVEGFFALTLKWWSSIVVASHYVMHAIGDKIRDAVNWGFCRKSLKLDIDFGLTYKRDHEALCRWNKFEKLSFLLVQTRCGLIGTIRVRNGSQRKKAWRSPLHLIFPWSHGWWWEFCMNVSVCIKAAAICAICGKWGYKSLAKWTWASCNRAVLMLFFFHLTMTV